MRGAHDVVRTRRSAVAHRRELPCGAVGELLRGEARAGCRALHLLAMFVHPGDKQDIVPVEPLKAGNRIGRDPLIGMADMRRAIGVGYRGRNIEGRAPTHEMCNPKVSAQPTDNGPRRVPFQEEDARAAAAKSANRDRTNGLLSRLKVSTSRAASLSFSHTRA